MHCLHAGAQALEVRTRYAVRACSCREEEALALFHRHSVQHIGEGVVLDAALKLFLAG